MKNVSHDDYIYTRNLIDTYVSGLISFPELLDVVPTTVNLPTILNIAYSGFQDKSIFTQFATKVINYYHKRISESNHFQTEEQFKKLLTVKEVFFLTDFIHIEKLLEGKEVNLGNEFREAFNPYKKAGILKILNDKVLGVSKYKVPMKLSLYNSLFNKEDYIKNPTGFVNPNGNISYVTEEIIDYAEKLMQENELFPAKIPTNRFLFETCKKQALENEEQSL